MTNHFNTQIGFGTSGLGNLTYPAKWESDLKAVCHAIDVGYKVIDTAEQYGLGKTETLVGQALKITGKRDSLHVVSKVLPANATSVDNIIKACESSISRMGCGYIDTYLLHWRDGLQSLEHVVEAMLELQARKLIKNYGVSNFDQMSLIEWKDVETQMGTASSFVTNQIYYSMTKRTNENSTMPWQQDNNISTMAFSPLDKGAIFKNNVVVEIAQRYGYRPEQLAIAWTIRRPNVISIPMSSKIDRITSNYESQHLRLGAELLSELDKKFPIL